jgi:hypothetical protein
MMNYELVVLAGMWAALIAVPLIGLAWEILRR